MFKGKIRIREEFLRVPRLEVRTKKGREAPVDQARSPLPFYSRSFYRIAAGRRSQPSIRPRNALVQNTDTICP
jgi:hypothetical protein